MFCPLFGVVLADYFLLRRGALRTEDLYTEGGPYWFTHGVNLVALLAWIVGFMIYMGFSAMLMEKVLGVKTALPWPLGSSLPSMIVAEGSTGLLNDMYGGSGARNKVVSYAFFSSKPDRMDSTTSTILVLTEAFAIKWLA